MCSCAAPTAAGSVEINPATLPRVRVNQGYANLIGRSRSTPCMRTQLQEARWLLRSLEIRNDTLIKVARCIVQRQTSFLEQGEERCADDPADVAEAVEMHESTISRVTSGKYMHTPRGVFELRYFFSSQVEARRHGHLLDRHPRQDPQADPQENPENPRR
jgi:RNA polymerase sigma-54 factor